MSKQDHFLSRYGDNDTREKISSNLKYDTEIANNLIESPLGMTDKMKESVIGVRTHALLKKHPLSFEHLMMAKEYAMPSAIISNTNLPNNPHRDEIHSKLAEDPKYHSQLAIMDDEHPLAPHVKAKLVDSIIKNNSKSAARQIINKRLDSDLTEKIINHFNDEQLDDTASRYGNLTDARVKQYVDSGKPGIANNMNLSAKQAAMVPGHIYHELDMLDQNGEFKK